MYPVCLDISGKLCVIIGGGRVAERKVKGLLDSGAYIRVISPEVTDELARLAEEGRIDWRKKSYKSDDLHKGWLVFAATNHREIQELICRQAEEKGQLINVVDDTGCCNFQVPATVRRGDLILAVSTNGKSPAVSAMIRKQLEGLFGQEYEVLLNLMAMIRQQAVTESATQADRKKIYKKILHKDIIEWIRAGKMNRLQDHLRDILGSEVDLDLSELKLEIS